MAHIDENKIQKRIIEYKKILNNIENTPSDFSIFNNLKREYEIKIHVAEWALTQTVEEKEIEPMYHCFYCNKKRTAREIENIPPAKNAEVQTDEYQIWLSCGHQLSIKLSNSFD